MFFFLAYFFQIRIQPKLAEFGGWTHDTDIFARLLHINISSQHTWKLNWRAQESGCDWIFLHLVFAQPLRPHLNVHPLPLSLNHTYSLSLSLFQFTPHPLTELVVGVCMWFWYPPRFISFPYYSQILVLVQFQHSPNSFFWISGNLSLPALVFHVLGFFGFTDSI